MDSQVLAIPTRRETKLQQPDRFTVIGMWVVRVITAITLSVAAVAIFVSTKSITAPQPELIRIVPAAAFTAGAILVSSVRLLVVNRSLTKSLLAYSMILLSISLCMISLYLTGEVVQIVPADSGLIPSTDRGVNQLV